MINNLKELFIIRFDIDFSELYDFSFLFFLQLFVLTSLNQIDIRIDWNRFT